MSFAGSLGNCWIAGCNDCSWPRALRDNTWCPCATFPALAALCRCIGGMNVIIESSCSIMFEGWKQQHLQINSNTEVLAGSWSIMINSHIPRSVHRVFFSTGGYFCVELPRVWVPWLLMSWTCRTSRSASLRRHTFSSMFSHVDLYSRMVIWSTAPICKYVPRIIYIYVHVYAYVYIYIICIWICVYVYTVMYNTHAYVYMRYSISISTTCYQSNQTQHTYLSMLPHVSLDCLGLPTLGISLQPSTWTWASQRWKPIPGQWFHGNIHSMVIVNSYGCIYTLAFSNCW